MTLLRRPEVCVLLAIVLAGLVWVALDQRSRGSGSTPASDTNPATRVLDLRISRAEMVADGSHRRLLIDFSARHEAADSLEVRSPTVRLLDAADSEVPSFFVPGAFPPALPPGPVAASWMEFWLTEAQAAGPLTLDLAGHRIRVPEVRTNSTGG